MAILTFVSVAIVVVAFYVPAAVEEYAKEAAVVEPTSLSLESISPEGVRARIQANFRLDGSRVRNEQVRRVGRVATWVVRELGTAESTVKVYLPEYGNILLGRARLPPLAVSIVDGHNTAVDFVAELVPGSPEDIRLIANEWLEGRLDKLRIQAKADIHLQSGLVPLGTHAVSESLVFEAKKLPEVPAYNITKLNFREIPIPDDDRKAMAAEASLSAYNQYPVQLDVPKLSFEVLVPNCDIVDPYIAVADATTSPIDVRPHSDIVAQVHGVVRQLPKSLITVCPDSDLSPLDLLLKQYLNGEPATLFVRGKKQPPQGTPDWIGEIMSAITVPIPFPGRTFDGLIRSFSLTDVHFTLPDPMAEPDDPDADPKVSGTIIVTAGLPSEMNFDINVTNVRASADVYYRGDKLGELDLHTWQKANSTRIEGEADSEATLKIQSRIEDAPLKVTDADVFSEVIQALMFGGKGIVLGIKALVDVKVQTVLGELVLKKVPAEGKIPVKPLPTDSVRSLKPKIGRIRILDTTYTSITLEALVNIMNPTPYTAYIPSISIHVLSNGSVVGEARAERLTITGGKNTNLVIGATWRPSMGGDKGVETGRRLLSEYVSGYNTTVTLRTHRGSIPSQPLLGEALSKLNMTLRAPRLRLPGDGDGDGDDSHAHFVRDATFHVFSSKATFTLVSPLETNTLYIEHVNATAFYNHTEPVGVIVHDLPFAAPPGSSTTPRLPVEWSFGSVGYDKLVDALGGTLKLDARAVVGVRLGNWKETIRYVGQGIGAHVRP